MRTISPALLAMLQSDVKTIATLWKITRKDGAIFGFTDHDVDIYFDNLLYLSHGGYTASNVESTSDLSTSNMEVNALFDSSVITQADLESGLWGQAAVSIFMVNYLDLTQGSVTLSSGVLGEFTIQNGKFTAELRGLAQIMQQAIGQIYSPTCRASLGDSRCLVNLAPLTVSGAVTSVASNYQFTDTSLTQTGPAVPYVDTTGFRVPSSPYQITIVPPTGGVWVSDNGVRDAGGVALGVVSGAPGAGQYSVSGGVYTFNIAQLGWEVFINYNYSIGYFAYGQVVWTGGANIDRKSDVQSFGGGVVLLAMPTRNPIVVGDTYMISAGCDRTLGTCLARFNNVVHFRGEPYVPGVDTILRQQGS